MALPLNKPGATKISGLWRVLYCQDIYLIINYSIFNRPNYKWAFNMFCYDLPLIIKSYGFILS